MTRFYFAAATTLLGLILAAMSLFSGQPLAALSLALAGLYCGLGAILGITETISNPTFQAAATIIGVIGLFAVFLYHSAFNNELQDAHRAALSSFVMMEMYCKPMPPELQKISEFGIKACATQDNLNQLSATSELAKGLYFGPTLSLADSAYSSSEEPPKDYCAQTFKTVSNICPDAFRSLSAAQQATLLGALK